MSTIVGSIKIRQRTTLLNLYSVDLENNTVVIGVGDAPTVQKDIRSDSNGLYFVHGCYKYYLSEFERRS